MTYFDGLVYRGILDTRFGYSSFFSSSAIDLGRPSYSSRACQSLRLAFCLSLSAMAIETGKLKFWGGTLRHIGHYQRDCSKQSRVQVWQNTCLHGNWQGRTMSFVQIWHSGSISKASTIEVSVAGCFLDSATYAVTGRLRCSGWKKGAGTFFLGAAAAGCKRISTRPCVAAA